MLLIWSILFLAALGALVDGRGLLVDTLEALRHGEVRSVVEHLLVLLRPWRLLLPVCELLLPETVPHIPIQMSNLKKMDPMCSSLPLFPL